MTGYLHRRYAESLAEFGTPQQLSGGWILEREIPGAPYKDAMGLYPLFCCQDWGGLGEDINNLKDLVSLVLVTDPLGDYEHNDLVSCFDVIQIFKQHFIVNLENVQISRHHRRNARKAREQVRVEQGGKWLGDWKWLYENLMRRHSIRGMTRFSDLSFEKQFKVPGLEVFRASQNGEAVAMLLWYVQGDKGYYHLGASSEKGYELKASFALFEASILYFSQSLRWLCLGAGVGKNGLTRFKRGWTNETRPAYLCGKVLDRKVYRELTGSTGGGFFPAYRKWDG